jgi:hypothetical protein
MLFVVVFPAPWHEVCVDLIGPWKIIVNGQALVFNALTCTDPVTCLTELSRIDNKTAEHVAMKFETDWLSWYPRPMRCVHDASGEFKGQFKVTLDKCGIKAVCITVKNPQANAIAERVHQTIANILRVLLRAHPPSIDNLLKICSRCNGYLSLNYNVRSSNCCASISQDLSRRICISTRHDA